MKKNNFLEIHFQEFSRLQKEVARALSNRTKSVQNKNKIYFDSVSSYRTFMTVQKIEILNMIASQRPNSIYELAKLVDRDFAAVFRDCTGLESAGFVTLKASNLPKGTKKPQLRFSYGGIIVYLAKHPYQIEFSVAA